MITAKEAVRIYNEDLPSQTIDEQKLQELDERIKEACANKGRKVIVALGFLNDRERAFITDALGYIVYNVNDGERKICICW